MTVLPDEAQSRLNAGAALAEASRLLPKDPAAAESLSRRLLTVQPDEPHACFILGAALRAQGDGAGALEVLAPLAARQPNSAPIQFELGLAALKLGEGRTAIGALSRAVSLDGKLAFGWKALESQLLLAGYGKAADEVRARGIGASVRRPEFAEAATALAEGRFVDAETQLRAHLTRAPTDAMGLYLLAEVGIRVDRLQQAESLLGRSVALAPDLEAARATYATLLLRLEKGAMALAQAQRLVERDPGHVGYRLLMASALEQTGDYAAALAWTEGLLAQFPDHPQAWVRYGHLARTIGDAAQSVEAYRKALALFPSLGDAYWGLANLKTYRFAEGDVASMRQLLARADLGQTDRRHICFSMGKVLEDAEDFPGAFEHYAAANALRRSEEPYDADELKSFVARAKTTFTQEFFAARAGGGCDAADPIFIVGLPRAGSTLTEQILASHSLVEGTRELSELWVIARQLVGETEPYDPRALFDRLETLSPQARERLGQDYRAPARIGSSCDL